MGYEQDLADRYNRLYEARKAGIKTKLDTGLNDVLNEENQVNSDYTSMANKLNDMRNETKQDFYGQRNGVDLLYNQSNNRMKNMASANNWRGGELQQMAQDTENTRMNNTGNLMTEESKAIKGYNNQEADSLRNKMLKIQEFNNRRNLLNQNYQSEDTATKNELEAQRMAELEQYNNQMRSASGGGSGRSSSGGSSSSSGKAPTQAQYTNMAYVDFENFDNPSDRLDWLEANKSDIIENAGYKTYTDMLSEAKKRYDSNGGYRDNRSNRPTLVRTDENGDYIQQSSGRSYF
jgi:hypothetical protein